MRNQTKVHEVEKKKVISIVILSAVSIIIALSGAFFSVYSFINNTSFRVLSSNVHGSIFGLVVLYLGVRYYLSVKKLKVEVYKSSSRLSWSNFRKEKSLRNL